MLPTVEGWPVGSMIERVSNGVTTRAAAAHDLLLNVFLHDKIRGAWPGLRLLLLLSSFALLAPP